MSRGGTHEEEGANMTLSCCIFFGENLDEYLKEHVLKYFAFTERFIPKTGYADETSLHFEIQDDKIGLLMYAYNRIEEYISRKSAESAD